MGCCSHEELGTMTTWWERNCSRFSHDFWTHITSQAILLTSDGFTFADSGEHYKLEDSPEGAWGTASHHGRADLQLRHECRIPSPPQSWSHQWKFASAHWEGQVSSRMFRWSGVGLLAEMAFLKSSWSNAWEFPCFHSPFVFNVTESFGPLRARRKIGNGSICWTHGSLLLQGLRTLSKAFSLSDELITCIWMLGWRDKGQCLEAGCKHFHGARNKKKHGFSLYHFADGAEDEGSHQILSPSGGVISLSWVWVSCICCYIGWLSLASDSLQTSWSSVFKPSVMEVNISKAEQWQEVYLLEGTSSVDLSTKKKVRMLYKWLCVCYLWNSGTVLKSEFHQSRYFQIGFISLWSICDCFHLLCGKKLSTVQLFLLPRVGLLWRGLISEYFPLPYIHCFSGKKLPLLQILGCNQRAACCSSPLPQEEDRKHVSAAGLTHTSWLIQDFG